MWLRLYRILLGISLTGFVALAVLWLRSYWAVDELKGIRLAPYSSCVSLASRQGVLRLISCREEEPHAFPLYASWWFVWETGKDAWEHILSNDVANHRDDRLPEMEHPQIGFSARDARI